MGSAANTYIHIVHRLARSNCDQTDDLNKDSSSEEFSGMGMAVSNMAPIGYCKSYKNV